MLGMHYSESRRGSVLFREMNTSHLLNVANKHLLSAILLKEKAEQCLSYEHPNGVKLSAKGRTDLRNAERALRGAYPYIIELVRRGDWAALGRVEVKLKEFMG